MGSETSGLIVLCLLMWALGIILIRVSTRLVHAHDGGDSALYVFVCGVCTLIFAAIISYGTIVTW